MPYTIRDSAEVVARIGSDIDTIRATVVEADPALQSLVLTGGYARGEGAFYQGQPQNDYDLVAIRRTRPGHVSYAAIRRKLEETLRIHIDLAPVPAWRLPHVPATIFWYETALRGRVLHGPDLLDRIPARWPDAIDRAEGLRLLTNRAAGLLLVTESGVAHEHRVQAAKGLLAAADAQLLASGTFAPSQRERWDLMQNAIAQGPVPTPPDPASAWLHWAFRFKVDPATAPPADARHAWKAARLAILEAVPAALKHAGLGSLDDYARRDGLVDHVVYTLRASSVPHGRRFLMHPTARVRVAAMHLLERTPNGAVRPEAARECLGDLAQVNGNAVALLAALRGATLP